MASLRADGKPMRALRSLRDSTPESPMTEWDVYRAHQVPGSWLQQAWHDALATLVKRGLAERCGGARPAQWFITDAGREALR